MREGLNPTKQSTPSYLGNALSIEISTLNSRDGVLVEFAIGAPILIAIMLYGHDIFKMARMKERMEFVAHEMISTKFQIET